MKTKDRILDTALDLFNQHGTGSISTNHIAEAAGISPGNLYYHFRNKEEIIRALFERLFHLWDVKLVLPHDRLPMLEDVRTLIETNFEILWQYRFVYRELIALLRHDTALQERFIAVRARGYEGFSEYFALFAPHIDHATVKRLGDLCWLISEFWLPTVEIRGETVDREQMREGIALTMQVLQPYLPP